MISYAGDGEGDEMLRLIYSRKKDRFQDVSVLGDAAGIRDLFWQLTHNYTANDGTEIGTIRVVNLDGVDCTSSIMTTPHADATSLSRLEA